MENKKTKIFFIGAVLVIIASAVFTICFLPSTKKFIPLNEVGINLARCIKEIFIDIFNLPISPYEKEVAKLSSYEYTIRNTGMFFSALIVGASLAMSGAAYQGVFRNPLVSPTILGVSSGANLGVLLCMFLFPSLMYTVSAQMYMFVFMFGIGTVVLVLLLSRLAGGSRRTTSDLLLMGAVISALIGAAIEYLQIYVSIYNLDMFAQFNNFIFGKIGSLSLKDAKDVLLIQIVLGVLPVVFMRFSMNAVTFGEEEARALGVNAKIMRIVIIMSGTLLVSSTVVRCGEIGWVGLIVPHMCRFFIGPDFRILLPASMVGGAALIMLVNNMNLIINSLGYTLPINMITTFIGTPLFFYILVKQRRNVE